MNFKKRIFGIDMSAKMEYLWSNAHNMYGRRATTYRKFYILLIPFYIVSKQIITVERGFEMMMGGKPYKTKL